MVDLSTKIEKIKECIPGRSASTDRFVHQLPKPTIDLAYEYFNLYGDSEAVKKQFLELLSVSNYNNALSTKINEKKNDFNKKDVKPVIQKVEEPKVVVEEKEEKEEVEIVEPEIEEIEEIEEIVEIEDVEEEEEFVEIDEEPEVKADKEEAEEK